jgi:uncharacterized protein (TIGR02594 family)
MSKHPWLDEALKDVGLKEVPGKRHNPKIVAMFAEAGHAWVKDDETAWCSAAANAWMSRAGIVGTGSLAARSWLTWGKSLNKQIRPGAVAVFTRGDPKGWQGHVAFCTGKETRTHIEVVGGNQRNAVTTDMYQKSRLLDTRWPSTAGNSRTVKAQVTSLASIGGGVVSDVATQFLPIAQETASYFDWAKYVAFGVGAIAAIATIIYRIQDIREKGR